MATELYTVTSGDSSLNVRAEGHRQHIWHSTTLVGVSPSAASKLQAFLAKHPFASINAGGQHPRVIGFEVRAEE